MKYWVLLKQIWIIFENFLFDSFVRTKENKRILQKNLFLITIL